MEVRIRVGGIRMCLGDEMGCDPSLPAPQTPRLRALTRELLQCTAFPRDIVNLIVGFDEGDKFPVRKRILRSCLTLVVLQWSLARVFDASGSHLALLSAEFET